MDSFFIFGAKYLYLVGVLLAFGYFLKADYETRKKMFVLFLISSPLAYLLGLGARQIYFNPRPFMAGNFEPLISHEADDGFPSDHVLFVAVISSLMLIFNKRLSLWLWLITIVVALSRVYAGIHHFIDVFGSLVIALFSVTITYILWKNIQTNSPSRLP